MEFGIQLQRGKSLNPKKDKAIWSIEDCTAYVEKNAKLPASKRGPSLHSLLQGSHIRVCEVKEEPSEEYRQRIEYLKKRQSQRDYESLVKGLKKEDKSLHVREALSNPMDSAKNALSAVMAAFTMGFGVYYLLKRSLKPQVSIPIGIIVFALMLVLEVVLMMSRFYLSEHQDPTTLYYKDK
ncbi:hypothetical protein WA577_004841 [Blastocystis sp. JDR]